jgi:hypothetical protein
MGLEFEQDVIARHVDEVKNEEDEVPRSASADRADGAVYGPAGDGLPAAAEDDSRPDLNVAIRRV